MYRFSEDMEFMQKLKTMHEVESVPITDSLIDLSARRTGRTFALQRIAIEKSIETGEWVMFLDSTTGIYYKFDTENIKQHNEHSFVNVLRWFEKNNVEIGVEHQPAKNNRKTFRFFLKKGSENHRNYQKLRIKPIIPCTLDKQHEVENNTNKKLLLLCR